MGGWRISDRGTVLCLPHSHRILLIAHEVCEGKATLTPTSAAESQLNEEAMLATSRLQKSAFVQQSHKSPQRCYNSKHKLNQVGSSTSELVDGGSRRLFVVTVSTRTSSLSRRDKPGRPQRPAPDTSLKRLGHKRKVLPAKRPDSISVLLLRYASSHRRSVDGSPLQFAPA